MNAWAIWRAAASWCGLPVICLCIGSRFLTGFYLRPRKKGTEEDLLEALTELHGQAYVNATPRRQEHKTLNAKSANEACFAFVCFCRVSTIRHVNLFFAILHGNDEYTKRRNTKSSNTNTNTKPPPPSPPPPNASRLCLVVA